jgi:histidinol-phosphate aminotransferase
LIHEGDDVSVVSRNANPVVRKLKPYVPGPTASEIHDRYGIALDQIVKLSSNEAPLGPSPKVREAIRHVADGDDLHRYPSSAVPQLRAVIATTLGVRAEQVLPAAGSSTTWPMIVRALSNAGDPVVWIDPSMTSYAEVAILSEREERSVATAPPFDVNVDDVAGAVGADAKVVFVSSPNNTTSRFVDPATIEELAARIRDTVIVVDEHYIEAADDFRTATAVSLIDSVPNVIVTRSLSKMYGLAGLRIGYVVGSDEAVKAIAPFRPNWSVNVVAEAAARAALEDVDHLERNIEATRDGREYLLKSLQYLDELDVILEPQGGFILFRPLARPGAWVTESLFRHGVMVRGDLLEGWIRVSVGTQTQNERFLEALTASLSDTSSS